MLVHVIISHLILLQICAQAHCVTTNHSACGGNVLPPWTYTDLVIFLFTCTKVEQKYFKNIKFEFLYSLLKGGLLLYSKT